MAEQGEASTTAEEFRSGTEQGEGVGRVGQDVQDGAENNVEIDRRAGDPLSSREEPFATSRVDKGKAPVPGVAPAQDGAFRGFSSMPAMHNWPFNPPAPGAGLDLNALGPLVPVLIPGPFPPMYPMQGLDQQPLPGGVFAVPVMPMYPGSMGSIPQGGFIPLSFSMPPVPPPGPAEAQTQAAPSPAARPAEAGRAAQQAGVRDGAVGNGLRQRHVAGVVRGRQGVPRPGHIQRPPPGFRGFQVGFQLDLLLILKLAVVVIVFNQDGSKDRLMLLLLLAGVVYLTSIWSVFYGALKGLTRFNMLSGSGLCFIVGILYQTGALAPILRWISLSAQRAMTPPQQHFPGAEGAPNAEGVGGPPPNIRDPPGPRVGEDTPPVAPAPDGAAAQGEAPPDRVGVNEERAEQPAQNPNWWGFLKEFQMIVVGFLTSLLPGFQHVE